MGRNGQRAKWKDLLEDDDVRRWYENLARGSELTAVDRARVLHRYLKAHRTTPKGLADLARRDRKAVEDQLQDFIGKLEKEGKAPGYILNYVKSVKSWLDHNEIRLVRKFKVRDAEATPTLDEERVPNKDELRGILGGATARGRVVISFVAFSGVRPEVLGNFRGTDGLRMRDLPEVQVVGNQVAFRKVPAIVMVRRELSKTGNRYFSFLPTEGCDYLKAYLETRLAAGEKLGPDRPVIAPTPGFAETGWRAEVADRPCIVTKNVTSDIRRALRPRFPWRPYVLRSYFDTCLLLAESQGKMTHAYRQFLMGHRGDIEARYTTNKGRLGDNVVEDMRRAFKAAEPFLATTATHISDVKEMLLETFREQARAYGIDPMKVRIEKERTGATVEPDDEIRLLTLEIAKRTAPVSMPSGTTFTNGEGRRNKVVKGERQLISHLDRGWELVSTFDGQRFLVRTAS